MSQELATTNLSNPKRIASQLLAQNGEGDHTVSDTHGRHVALSIQAKTPNRVANSISTPASSLNGADGDHLHIEAHAHHVAAAPDWKGLRIASEMFWDLQQFRIACGNRAERGGVDPATFTSLLEALDRQEKALGKALVKEYRATVRASIQEWVESTKGLGEPTMARFLGTLGDPLIASPSHWEGKGRENRRLVSDPPYYRTFGQLRAYCGVGDPSKRRHKGQESKEIGEAGSPRLRTLLHLMATSCLKTKSSPYRQVYLDAREEYEAREDWTPLHRHNAALRKVAKEILRDLWVVSSG